MNWSWILLIVGFYNLAVGNWLAATILGGIVMIFGDFE